MPVFVVLSCVAACMYVLSYVTSVRLSGWINKKAIIIIIIIITIIIACF